MYRYEDLKPQLFTEAGSVMFTRIRDNVRALLNKSGAVTMDAATRGISDDIWAMSACVDRMVELGELREVGADEPKKGQHRVFVPGREWARKVDRFQQARDLVGPCACPSEGCSCGRLSVQVAINAAEQGAHDRLTTLEQENASLWRSLKAANDLRAMMDATLDEFASHHPREDGQQRTVLECVKEAMATLRARIASLEAEGAKQREALARFEAGAEECLKHHLDPREDSL